MSRPRTEVVVLAVLVGLALVALVVLALAGKSSPPVLEYVVAVGVGAVAGVAVPSATPTAPPPEVPK